jgi:hypothetical protein
MQTFSDRLRQFLGGVKNTATNYVNKVAKPLAFGVPQVQQAATNFGNYLNQGVNRVQTALKTDPAQFNIFASMARDTALPFQNTPLNSLSRNVGSYLQNRYVQPIADLPKNINQTFGKNRTFGERLIGGLGVAGGVATVIPDPIQDVGMPLYDLYKGAQASSIRGGSTKENLLAGVKSATLEKPTGLGTAFTTNPTGEMVGNLAEIPLMLGLTAKVGKGTNIGYNKGIVKKFRDTVLQDPEARAAIGEFATIMETTGGKGNIGKIGETVQMIAGDLFGREKTANLTNKQLKNLFDVLSQQAGNQSLFQLKKLGGMSVANLREKTPRVDLSSLGAKERGFAQTVGENKKTPEILQAEMEKYRYNPLSNKATLKVAEDIIKKSEPNALEMAKNGTDTQANAVALRLIEKYIDQGRIGEADDLVAKVSPRFTQQGQQVQILATYGRLTPTGAIKYAQSLIDKANKANPRLGLKLTEENTKTIVDLAKNIKNLPEGSRDKTVAIAQLLQKISDQIPASAGQKISTFQTMMQLINPKTAIRNIVGNTIFSGMENLSDVVGAGVDAVTSLITGKRTKVLPSLKAQGQGLIKGFKEGAQDVKLGIDTSGGVTSQFELNKKTFTDPILGTLEKALNYELRVPDRAAFTAAFEASLNNQMRAAKATAPTPEMTQTAFADGLYRTFQDNSRLAQLFSGAKKTFNKIGTPDGKFGVGDLVLKYPKTPANILSRGLDYSPFGFVKGIYEGVRPLLTGQAFNQKAFVESLSRAMAGSGLIAAGYTLAKNGIITGKAEKDYDISSVQRTTGQGAFRINVDALKRFFASGGKAQDAQNGDTLVTYDWAQPTSLAIAMGANQAMGGQATDALNAISASLQSGVDTLTGQPMVKNLMDYTTAIKNKGAVAATRDLALGSATGFVPSLLRQSANVFDPKQRETYNPSPVGEAVNKIKATIPGLRNTLQPKIDVFGKEMPNYPGGGIQRLFDIFANPAFVSKVQENPAAKEVLDIYQRSGETSQAPRVAPQTVQINGESIKVTPEQYTQYQTYIGTKTDQLFNSLVQDPSFKALSDEEKANLMQQSLTDINSAAKIQVFGNNPKSVSGNTKMILKGGGASNLMASSATPTSTTSSAVGGQYTIIETETGQMKTVDLATPIEYPTLTGDGAIDKELLSKYKTKLNARADNIVALLENNKISLDQAKAEMAKVQSQLKKTKTAKKVNAYAKLKAASSASTLKLTLPRSGSTYKAPILRAKVPKVLSFKGKALKLRVDQYKTKASL